MTDDWQFDVPTTGTKHLPPDSRYMEALSSQGYGFETAIADLVDNSIDAGARDVVIHFLRDEDRLVSLLVIDDGKGMTEEELDVAMTVGGRRGYDPQSLGMFGTGLKSASLSHAAAVTVVSKTRRTRAVGRRWLMERAVSGYQCDIVAGDYAQSLIDRYSDRPITWQGTVIRWDGVKDFPRHGGGGQTNRYLLRTINRLGLQLGLYLHRFLARDDFNITIAVEDVNTGTEYMNFGVEPLDPFAYPVSGHPDHPRRFTVDCPSIRRMSLEAHIWPAKSTLDGFKAVGTGLDRQGFYFYRHNRLVQAGGWNNFRQPEQHLALARVAVDLPSDTADVFRLTVKKEGWKSLPSSSRRLTEPWTPRGEGSPGTWLRPTRSIGTLGSVRAPPGSPSSARARGSTPPCAKRSRTSSPASGRGTHLGPLAKVGQQRLLRDRPRRAHHRSQSALQDGPLGRASRWAERRSHRQNPRLPPPPPGLREGLQRQSREGQSAVVAVHSGRRRTSGARTDGRR